MIAQERNTTGTIDERQAYTLKEFRRRAGLGATAWRNVRDKLPVRVVGRKRYVLGQDWLEFLRQQ